MTAKRLYTQFAYRRWAGLLLTCLGLGLACGSPLKVRKDAAPPPDAASDSPTDLPAAPDLPAPDLPPADTRPPPSGPRAFRLDNRTDRTAYVLPDQTVQGRMMGPSGWDDFFFFPLWCQPWCDTVTSASDCCWLCEQPIPSLLTIPPGGSLRIPWDLGIYRKSLGACDRCGCQQRTVVSEGSYAAYAYVSADYTCTPPGPCGDDGTGRITWARPGLQLDIRTPFTVPSDGDDVVLVISTLPQSDAGTAADASDGDTTADAADGRTPADVAEDLAADAPAVHDTLADGFPGAFAELAGHTFEIAANNTAPDASAIPNWPCRPADRAAVYHLVFSADGSEVIVVRWDPVQEPSLHGTLSSASDSALVYNLLPTFAGTRLSIRRENGVLVAQLAELGSGLPVVACIESSMKQVD